MLTTKDVSILLARVKEYNKVRNLYPYPIHVTEIHEEMANIIQEYWNPSDDDLTNEQAEWIVDIVLQLLQASKEADAHHSSLVRQGAIK